MGRIAADSVSLMAFNIIYIMRTNIEVARLCGFDQNPLTILDSAHGPFSAVFYFG
jgi:hypothetical protein